MLKTLGDPPVRLALWDGKEIATSHEPTVARVFIGDRPTLRRLILDPEFQFGEAYSQGRLEVDGDLRDFLEIFYRTRLHSGAASHPLKKIWTRLLHARRSNSLAGSRENIHRHYDIGNDFYQLWLDPRMIYSCAYFAREDMTLAEAQLAKLDYVCRKLWLRPGETVVDIGGGWGGLAIHMARHYGVTVKAFNISRQQNEFARHRARAEQLDGRVEFIEDDYRNITGRFDALVSLGMLEHVGKKHYRDFGRTADRCLAPHGRGLIQTIAQNQPGRNQSLDPAADIPGRPRPHPSRNDRHSRTLRLFRAGPGKPPPALCQDPRTLARAFRSLGRKRGKNVRRQIRAHVATLPFRVLCGIRQRRTPTFPVPFCPPRAKCSPQYPHASVCSFKRIPFILAGKIGWHGLLPSVRDGAANAPIVRQDYIL